MEEVEQTKAEDTAAQDSPTVEENQPEVEAEGDNSTEAEAEEGDASEALQEKNWRALRKENEELKARLNAQQAPEEPSIPVSQRDLNLLMSPEDKVELRIREVTAERDFPELKTDRVFKRAVEGEYMDALAKYNRALLEGRRVAMPDPYAITKSVKQELYSRVAAESKKAEVEGAKKAKEAKESREATVEAEGRSDRGKSARSASELSDLQLKTRRGDSNALAERLSRSGL